MTSVPKATLMIASSAHRSLLSLIRSLSNTSALEIKLLPLS